MLPFGGRGNGVDFNIPAIWPSVERAWIKILLVASDLFAAWKHPDLQRERLHQRLQPHMSALELRLVAGVGSMFSRRLSPQHSGSAAAADSHGCTAAIPPDEGGRWIEDHFSPRRRHTLRAPLGGDVERLQAGQTRVEGGNKFTIIVSSLFQ